jgi:hypothetical protein
MEINIMHSISLTANIIALLFCLYSFFTLKRKVMLYFSTAFILTIIPQALILLGTHHTSLILNSINILGYVFLVIAIYKAACNKRPTK